MRRRQISEEVEETDDSGEDRYETGRIGRGGNRSVRMLRGDQLR